MSENQQSSFRFAPTKNWFDKSLRPDPLIVGDTIPEAYLNSCARLGSKFVCDCDAAMGEINYAKSRVITLLIADSVKNLEAERVGIIMPSLAATDHLVFGCIMAGKVPVLLNWTLGRASLDHVLKTAELSTVLTSRKVWSRMDAVPKDLFEGKMVFLEDILKKGATPWGKIKALLKSLLPKKVILSLYGRTNVKPDDTALILFTSGSENFPKGVPLSHRNLLVNSDDAHHALRVKGSDSIFAILPPFHSYGLTTSLILPIVAGVRSVHYPNPLDYKTMASMIADWKPSILPATQTFLRGIVKAAKPGEMDSIHMAVSGGERTPKELFDLFDQLPPQVKVREGYGITECAPVVSVGRWEDPNPEGVGLPFDHVTAAIVHIETKEPFREPYKEGLICVSGPSIFNGYLDPNIPSPFLNFDGRRWYNTGDIGYLTQKGEIVISGRQKRFVKIGGEMISLPALEQVLEEKWPPTSNGPSLALQYFESGRKPQIVLLSPLDLDLTEINDALKDGGFSNLARISKVLKVEKIPLQGTGKTDFRALKEIAQKLLEEEA